MDNDELRKLMKQSAKLISAERKAPLNMPPVEVNNKATSGLQMDNDGPRELKMHSANLITAERKADREVRPVKENNEKIRQSTRRKSGSFSKIPLPDFRLNSPRKNEEAKGFKTPKRNEAENNARKFVNFNSRKPVGQVEFQTSQQINSDKNRIVPEDSTINTRVEENTEPMKCDTPGLKTLQKPEENSPVNEENLITKEPQTMASKDEMYATELFSGELRSEDMLEKKYVEEKNKDLENPRKDFEPGLEKETPDTIIDDEFSSLSEYEQNNPTDTEGCSTAGRTYPTTPASPSPVVSEWSTKTENEQHQQQSSHQSYLDNPCRLNHAWIELYETYPPWVIENFKRLLVQEEIDISLAVERSRLLEEAEAEREIAEELQNLAYLSHQLTHLRREAAEQALSSRHQQQDEDSDICIEITFE